MPIRVEVRKPLQGDVSHSGHATMCLRRYNGEWYENATDPVPLDLQHAMAEVRSKMNALCERDTEEQIIADQEVYIQVTAKQFPPLNLIDLPGMVRASRPDDKRHKLEQATKDLFDRYSGLANSLFLCVGSMEVFEKEGARLPSGPQGPHDNLRHST